MATKPRVSQMLGKHSTTEPHLKKQNKTSISIILVESSVDTRKMPAF